MTAQLVSYTQAQVETEKRNRIRLAVAAYAYEVEQDMIMSDDEFDQLVMSINPQMDTGNPKVDEFFKDEFTTQSVLWVHWHPEQENLRRIYQRVWAGRIKNKPTPPPPVSNTRSWMED